MKRIIIVVIVQLLLNVSSLMAADYVYLIEDLGLGSAYDINDLGNVVGQNNNQHAFLWTSNAGMQDLGTLGGNESAAYGINNLGQITGSSKYNTYSWPDYNAAFFWDGQLERLDYFSGGSDAYAINNNSKIAGSYQSSGSNATIWETDGWQRDLGFSTSGSVGNDINDSNHVAGTYRLPGINKSHAFVWDEENGIRDLSSSPDEKTGANAINNEGNVVGYLEISQINYAVFWRNDGAKRGLGLIGEEDAPVVSTMANDINDTNQVVGTATGVDPFEGNSLLFSRAFVWDEATGMLDLNDLIDPNSGWQLESATAINESGQIAGTGIFNGEQHAFRLTAVAPEPVSTILFLVGAAPLGFGLYKKKRNR